MSGTCRRRPDYVTALMGNIDQTFPPLDWYLVQQPDGSRAFERLCSHQGSPRVRSVRCPRMLDALAVEDVHYANALRVWSAQYGGQRMPWYPAGVACDDCPNPSRGLVQRCLWARVKAVALAPDLAGSWLARSYGACFDGLP